LRYLLGMLPAWMIIVWQDHDIGTAE